MVIFTGQWTEETEVASRGGSGGKGMVVGAGAGDEGSCRGEWERIAFVSCGGVR